MQLRSLDEQIRETYLRHFSDQPSIVIDIEGLTQVSSISFCSVIIEIMVLKFCSVALPFVFFTMAI